MKFAVELKNDRCLGSILVFPRRACDEAAIDSQYEDGEEGDLETDIVLGVQVTGPRNGGWVGRSGSGGAGLGGRGMTRKQGW